MTRRKLSGSWNTEQGGLIDRMLAWVFVEADGTETIVAFADNRSRGAIRPNMEAIQRLRPYAERVAADGFEVRLIEFTGRLILERLGPRFPGDDDIDSGPVAGHLVDRANA